MKIRPGHHRDFWAYVKFNRHINGRVNSPTYFCPDPNYFNKGSGDTLKCFVEHESIGKINKMPKQPRLLKLALDGKKLVNFSIEQWAVDLAEGLLILSEIQDQLSVLPEWVTDALLKQWAKNINRNYERYLKEKNLFGATMLMIELSKRIWKL